MKRPVLIFGASCLAATLLISACSSSSKKSSTTTSAAASGSGSAAASSLPVSGTIKLGLVYEGGGALQAGSLAFQHGIGVAVDQANQAGGAVVNGKRYNFALDSCNDNGDQTQTTGCIDKLVLDNGDKFIFGGLADFGPIVRGVTEANQTVYFSSGTAVGALMSSSHYVVDVTPADTVRFATDVKALKKAFPNATKVAFIGDQSQTWTKDINGIKPLLSGSGLTDVDEEQIPANVSDFSSFLTKAKASSPDVIVSYMASPARSQVLLKENQTLQVAKGYLNPSSACAGISIGANPGVTVVSNTNIGAAFTGDIPANVQKYISDYYAGGYTPNPDPSISTALFAYDAVGWLALAMAKAGSTTDTSSILTAMNSITYDGLNGKITMANNQETYGQVFCTSVDGSTNYTSELIEP